MFVLYLTQGLDCSAHKKSHNGWTALHPPHLASTAAQLFCSISQSDLHFPIRFPSLRRNMASEWSIHGSFISHGPVHLRKWEKARQTHGPDVAEFIRYFHTNWIYPMQPVSGVKQIIHTLLSACFTPYLCWMKLCLHVSEYFTLSPCRMNAVIHLYGAEEVSNISPTVCCLIIILRFILHPNFFLSIFKLV